MQAVILAGGMGARIAEETGSRPKTMVEIGGKPILWHILKIYSAHGIHDFVIPLGNTPTLWPLDPLIRIADSSGDRALAARCLRTRGFDRQVVLRGT